MTPKATGWDELHLAENPAVELLESLGYAYVPPEYLDRRARRASRRPFSPDASRRPSSD